MAALVLAMMLPVVPAGAAVTSLSAPVDQEFQVTFEEHSQNQIEMWGDTVVYKDHRGGQPAVYATNLLTGAEMPISVTNGTQNNPSVYGDWVAYMKTRMVWDENDSAWEDRGDIWVYNMATGERKQISDGTGEECNPYIYGDHIAWVDWNADNDPIDPWDSPPYVSVIKVYDMATSTEATIAHKPDRSVRCVSVHENYVLYRDATDWASTVYAYDLETSTETTVVAARNGLEDPYMWGKWIVWSDASSGTDSIYAYNMDTKAITLVSSGTHSAYSPDIWEGKVVWREDRGTGTGYDIYMKDLASGVETVICDDPAKQGRPRISHGAVTWVDERNADAMDIDNADIYGMFLEPKSMTTAGATRYDTAVMNSRAFFPAGADTVVLATGANWPDALAASSLAGACESPILLVKGDSIPAAVTAEILRLGARNAYIVGGTGVVSAGVEADVNALLTGDVVRLAGANRYATAQMVAAEAVDVLGSTETTAIVATGQAFPDAVAASALCAGLGYPLYLTSADSIADTTIAAMKAAGVKDVYVLGGTGAVSAGVMTKLDADFGAVERLFGADRYATAVAVAQEGVDNGMTWDGVALATGTNFPDALTGGVTQGLTNSVMVLTPTNSLNSGVKAKIEAEKDDIGLVRFLGGEGAISKAVKDAVAGILG